MKKFLAVAALTIFIGAAAVCSADVALIYDNDAAVVAGRSTPASVVDGGAAVPSAGALATANTLLYGDGDGLFRGLIARLDNDVNLAVVRRGERVGDKALQEAHAQRWQASAAFLNIAVASAAANGAPGVVTIAPTAGGTDFAVKLNGGVPGAEPMVLHERFNKSSVKLEVVNTSTVPVWAITVQLTSDPALSFWKEGRHGGLNDVPTKVFTHTQQAVFSPIKPGATFSVPIEIYFIKEHDYIFNFKITAKGRAAEHKVLVRFE